MLAEPDTPARAGKRHAFELTMLYAKHMLEAPTSPPACAEDREYLEARQATFTRIVKAMKREAGIEDEQAEATRARGAANG